MVQSRAATVDDYLLELPPDRRPVVERLRELTRAHLSEFQEGMEYGMPYYRGPGGATFAFASQAGYVALYVGPRAADLARKKELDVGASCVRIRRLDSIDWGLMEELVRSARP